MLLSEIETELKILKAVFFGSSQGGLVWVEQIENPIRNLTVPIFPFMHQFLECKASLAEAISLILDDRREDRMRGLPEDAVLN